MASIWRENMQGYLSAAIICSMRTVSRNILSKEKYTSIFSRKVEAIVFIILQIFCKGSEKMFTNSLLYTAWDVFF